jgi:hypothetical protein
VQELRAALHEIRGERDGRRYCRPPSGVRFPEILVEDRFDTAVILSGDTDLASAYRTAARLVKDKTVTFAFSYEPG